MGKTASTRTARKPRSKQPERKLCTCQERCNGGKEVAASTYRSHNPAIRYLGLKIGVGTKRKAVDDGHEGVLCPGGEVRETRGMRARRVAQNREAASQSSATTTQNRVETRPEVDFAQTQLEGRKSLLSTSRQRSLSERLTACPYSVNTTRHTFRDPPKATVNGRRMSRRGYLLWKPITLSKTERRLTKITRKTTSSVPPYVLSTRWYLLYSPGIDELLDGRLLLGIGKLLRTRPS